MEAAYDIDSLRTVGSLYLPQLADLIGEAARTVPTDAGSASMFTAVLSGLNGVLADYRWEESCSVLQDAVARTQQRVDHAGKAIVRIAERYAEAERTANDSMLQLLDTFTPEHRS